MRRATLLGLLCAATALVVRSLGPSRAPVVRVIALGRLPDAVALAPGGGRAFVADDAAATVSVLDLADGRLVRTVAVGQPGLLAPLALTLDARTRHLFVADRGDNGAPSVVHVLDSRSGVPLTTIRVGPSANAMAVDAPTDRVVVTTGEDGAVSLLDARRVTVLHTTRMHMAPVALAIDPRTAHAFVVQAAGAEGAYNLTGGQISTLDTRTGAVVQTVAVGQVPLAIAADARTARVFVTNGGGKTVSVLDARSGRVLRTVPVGWRPGALAVDARQARVFVVNDGDGSLSVLDARSGALLSTLPVFAAAPTSAWTPPYTVAVDDARERVYMTAWDRFTQGGVPVGRGQLAVLDARDGRVLRMIAVGVAPQALAVEESSGRVVVVDGGGMVQAPQQWGQQWRVQVARWAPWLAWLTPHATAMMRVPGDVEVVDPGV